MSKASLAKQTLDGGLWTLLGLIHKHFSSRHAAYRNFVNLLEVIANERQLIAILEVCSTPLYNKVNRAGTLCHIEIGG